MRVNRLHQVASRAAHLDGQHPLRDQFARARADDANTKHRVGLRIDQYFRQAVGPSQGVGPAAGNPGVPADFDGLARDGQIVLRQARPRNLRVGEDDGRDGPRGEERGLAVQGFDRHLALMAGAVGEHRLAADVADCEQVRVGSPLLAIDLDEALGRHHRLRVLQAEPVGVGATSHGHEHPRKLLHARPVRPLERGAHRCASVFEFHHLGAEHDRRKQPFDPLLQGLYQIAVSAGEERVGEFHHRHLRAELRVDRPHFEADVAPADHQQRLGHVGQFEGAGGIHHSGTADVERRNPARTRAARQDAMLKRDRLAGPARFDGCHFQRRRTGEPGGAADQRHVASSGELGEAAGEC